MSVYASSKSTAQTPKPTVPSPAEIAYSGPPVAALAGVHDTTLSLSLPLTSSLSSLLLPAVPTRATAAAPKAITNEIANAPQQQPSATSAQLFYVILLLLLASFCCSDSSGWEQFSARLRRGGRRRARTSTTPGNNILDHDHDDHDQHSQRRKRIRTRNKNRQANRSVRFAEQVQSWAVEKDQHGQNIAVSSSSPLKPG